MTSANLRGVILMVLSMAAFAASDGVIKALAGAIPAGQLIALTGMAAAVIFLGACLVTSGRPRLAHLAHPTVSLRVLSEIIGAMAYVTALTLIPLSSATAIAQSAPLFTVALAAILLKEQVGPRRWIAIFVGLAGVLLILRPGLQGFQPAGLLALLGAAMLACRDVLSRLVPRHISNVEIGFWGFLAQIPGGWLLLHLTGATPGPLDGSTLPALAGISALVALAVYFITAAMRAGEVSAIAPFRYTRLVFAMVIAMLIFGERPDTLTWLGAAIVVGTGLYTLWREARAMRPANAGADRR